ncbi:MAG: type I-E CRISPR-associated protein Cas5/CasD [Lachnospiraceae bacterium]
MSTLLLRLAAPLQAWGAGSKFEIRKTLCEPTKSGVVGLLAAALGRKREESVDDLIALRFGVRVDQEGKLLKDFQMVHNGKKPPAVTSRYYLADAVFLVALESDNEVLLKELEAALQHPAYPLFLGRRSCPPTQPLSLGIRYLSLIDALREEPWQAAEWRRKRINSSLRVITDCTPQEVGATYQRDIPVSFNPKSRQYGYRTWKEQDYVEKGEVENITLHDPMAEL